MHSGKASLIWLMVLVAGIAFYGLWTYLHPPPRPEPTLSHEDVVAEMQHRARLAVADAREVYGVELDFSAESVERLEEVLAQVHERHRAEPFSEVGLNRQTLKWGGYLGEVIKRARASEWRLGSEVAGEGALPIVYEDGSESYPVLWCLGRIVNGAEDNVWHKFNVLVIHRDLDPAEAAARLEGELGAELEVTRTPEAGVGE